MNCIIIEDEHYAVKHLENQLAQISHEMNIQMRLGSVSDAVQWLRSNNTDLIFLDIQLEDGISFEIFDHVEVKTPVIFTTSYNQYITKAFDINSISYLLKPVELDKLKQAIDKYNFLYHQYNGMNEKMLPLHTQYQKRFLVNQGNHLHAIQQEDIAWFYIANKRYLFIVTKNNEQYIYNSNLEIIEQRLDPSLFFRVNRNFIIRFDAIKQMQTLGRQIIIETDPSSKEEITVSVSRTGAFKEWLDR